MGLKIKQPPKALSADKIEIIWPGDDAVDHEASDLVAWVKNGGGRDGLVFHEGITPDVILCKPLNPREFQSVSQMLAEGSVAYCQAFRYGCMEIGGKRLRRSQNGARLWEIESSTYDAILGDLDLYCDLPFAALMKNGEDLKPSDEELISLSLPHAVGTILFNHYTFRRG